METLVAGEPGPLRCDVLIVGSGYGACIAAAELAGAGKSVWVLERGREYALGEFPQDIGQLPGHVQLRRSDAKGPVGRADALFDLRTFDGGAVLVANGLGGGSLINAGVALEPDIGVFKRDVWPQQIRQLATAQGGKAIHDAFREAGRLLGAAPMPDAGTFQKHQALKRLGAAAGAAVKPAPVTIATQAGPNRLGIEQSACIGCGNCFTGCNYGAKGTLSTNLIPLAQRQGAKFWTGATVTEVEPLASDTGGDRYVVRFGFTEGVDGASHEIRARTVILGAGALGSTELLKRSPKLDLSNRLGKGFSTNGDAIAMGWGQSDAVNGFSRHEAGNRKTAQAVGPTITGYFETSVELGGRPRKVLLQDGAVPAALADTATILGSSLSMFHRFIRTGAPGFFDRADSDDWVATPDGLAAHAQLLLAMGDDDADGEILLHDGKLDIRWPSRPADADGETFLRRVHDLLKQAQGDGGFDGGDYLPSPLWRPLPDDFSEVAGAGAQVERRITVHPLGGCGMGPDAQRGVVDAAGTVYRGQSGTAVYEGLHVLDGAILPCSVGVNPFLTITVLALLGARAISGRSTPLGDGVAQVPTRQPSVAAASNSDEPSAVQLRTTGQRGIQLKFEERLVARPSDGDAPARWIASLLTRYKWPAARVASWVAVVEVEIELDDWLANPSIGLPARLRLWPDEVQNAIAVRPELLKGPPLLEGSGTVRLLALDKPGLLDAPARAVQAVRAFMQRRPGESSMGQVLNPLNWGGVYATVMNHTRYRLLDYEFPELRFGDEVVCKAAGTKRLAYAPGEKPMWSALIELPLAFSQPGREPDWDLQLDVDLADLVRERRLQVTKSPSTPAAIIGLAAFAATWVRALVQCHFWSFRGLTYEEIAPRPTPGDLACPVLRPNVVPRLVTFEVTAPCDTAPTRLELHRYDPPAPAAGEPRCILLIHGLAHGSGVFTTQTVDQNMAEYFLSQGYVVWVLDHRLSNRLQHAAESHSIDDVACDVAQAIEVVSKHHGDRPIDVFAHCVGAAAFSMAVLQGKVAGRIRAATIHAVHPWVVPSTTNRFSAALAALYKDLLPADLVVDPLPPSGSGGAIDEVLDRIAATLPWPDAELPAHDEDKHKREAGFAICNRMTLFYGREWMHENLDARTHAGLHKLVGPAGINVFRQLFFIALRQRVTDRQGGNVYLTSENVVAHWDFPTLFAHGSENRVFDVRCAVRSWHRLALTQGRVPHPKVKLFVCEGYGHMDFLFGRHAARDIYPQLGRFFAQREAFTSVAGTTLDPDPKKRLVVGGADITDYDARMTLVPACGPMLQVERTPQRRLVLWVEQRNDATSQVALPVVRVNGKEVALGMPAVLRLPANQAPVGGHAYWVLQLQEDQVAWAELEKLDVGLRYLNSRVDNHPPLFSAGRANDGTIAHVGLMMALEPGVPPPTYSPPAGELEVEWAPVEGVGQPWFRRWLGEPTGSATFLAASCRWPGLPFERESVDAMAAGMLGHVAAGPDDDAADALVLLGDQVYADATANVAETTEVGERGAFRYREAWAAPNAAALLRSLPTWFVVDDHEFGDDVSEFGVKSQRRDLELGFSAAHAYQWRWHRPDWPDVGAGAQARRGFWHEFDIGGIPAFAADTRTERESRADRGRAAAIMGAEQCARIEDWLLRHASEPKILCSGSVFGIPLATQVQEPATWRHADDWTGYPASWARLVAFVVANEIRNLVFLSGDYHLSAIAQLTLASQGKSAHALSIACSAWNATLPFANCHASEFDWGSAATLSDPATGSSITSVARLLSAAPRQFSKISVAAAGRGCDVRVRVYAEGLQQAAVDEREQLQG